MLHYRIMSYDSDADWVQLVDLISLRDDGCVEREFIRRLNSLGMEEPFADELSAKLMEDIADSRRAEGYAVETPGGKGCITCLPAEVKFGLMVIEMAKQGSPVIVRVGSVGWNIIEWLSRNGDFTLVLTDNECDRSLMEILTMVSSGLADLEYQGQTYTDHSISECMTALDKFLYRDVGE